MLLVLGHLCYLGVFEVDKHNSFVNHTNWLQINHTDLLNFINCIQISLFSDFLLVLLDFYLVYLRDLHFSRYELFYSYPTKFLSNL